MKVLTDHLADPGNLGIHIGMSSVVQGQVYVILHHRDTAKHKIIYADTLAQAVAGKILLADLGL